MSAPRRSIAPQMRWVAVPAAIALGSIGSIAAERAGLPPVLGIAAGALAAVLAVLGLPSLPTRRVAILLLGVGGLGALRHASYPGPDRSLILTIWAAATLVAVIMVDRAEAETAPALHGAGPLRPRAAETARVAGFVGLAVIVAAVALVPTVTERLGRRVWPGAAPSFLDLRNAPSSLRSSERLDMTSRPRLTDAVVFTVQAPRPDFWRGETFDVWDGRTWTRSDDDEHLLDRDPFSGEVFVPAARHDVGALVGEEMRQTFHIESGYSEVVFAAPSARVVETDRILRGRGDGTARVAGGADSAFGKGSVYTVTSRHLRSTAADLQNANGPVPEAILERYAQQPITTNRVRALAAEITAGQTTTFGKILALESWMEENLEYSLNAPLAPSGVDVVDDFLFRSRLGWCEQIASSLVVMARSVGIPARLTTGFVPGERDALTGRFVVRERDAHAWAEIYFPDIGWQGFDPTASVPLSGEANEHGSWLAALRKYAVPLIVLVLVVIAALTWGPALVAAVRNRRTRRAAWSSRTLDRLEKIGRKAGRARAPAETPREYAHVLAETLGVPQLEQVGATLDEAAYSGRDAPEAARDAADAVLSSLRP